MAGEGVLSGALLAAMGGVAVATLSAPWEDLTADLAGSGVGQGGAATLLFAGEARAFRVTRSGVVGGLEYSIGGGAWTLIASGGTFSASPNASVAWRWGGGANNGTGTVTVTDVVPGMVVGVFQVTTIGA